MLTDSPILEILGRIFDERSNRVTISEHGGTTISYTGDPEDSVADFEPRTSTACWRMELRCQSLARKAERSMLAASMTGSIASSSVRLVTSLSASMSRRSTDIPGLSIPDCRRELVGHHRRSGTGPVRRNSDPGDRR